MNNTSLYISPESQDRAREALAFHGSAAAQTHRREYEQGPTGKIAGTGVISINVEKLRRNSAGFIAGLTAKQQ